MIKTWLASLRKPVGRVWEMSAYLTSIGAVFVSVGVVLFIELPKEYIPNWGWIAPFITLVGIVFVVVGGIKVLVEEKQQRRQQVTTLILFELIARKLGVDIDEATGAIEEKYDKWKLW